MLSVDSKNSSTMSAPLPSLAAADVPYPPIFVGGAGRSGTTLLRVILDSHSRIACGPELKVLPLIAKLWADLQAIYAPYLAESNLLPPDIDRAARAMIVSLLGAVRRQSGKPRIAEKTPNNVFVFRHLHAMFPHAAYVHMIRDGRDVVASLLTMDWRGPDGERVDYTSDAGAAARYWVSSIRSGRVFAETTRGSSRYFELRYESLIGQPEAALRRLFEFLGEPWEPGVLEYHRRQRALGIESSAEAVTRPLYQSAVGRWRHDLDSEQLAAVKEEAGQTLIELGYCKDLAW
jgi:hypothetical protein